MEEQDLKDYLSNIVIQYGTKWNEIENNIYELHKQEEDELKLKYPGNEFYYAKRTNWFDKFSTLISPLFDEFCTDKNRVYGGKKVKSFGFSGKFNGIERPTEKMVVLKNKNRAEVYIKTSTNLSDEYLFILLRKDSLWKIDNYKNRRYGNEKWNKQIL